MTPTLCLLLQEVQPNQVKLMEADNNPAECACSAEILHHDKSDRDTIVLLGKNHLYFWGVSSSESSSAPLFLVVGVGGNFEGKDVSMKEINAMYLRMRKQKCRLAQNKHMY